MASIRKRPVTTAPGTRQRYAYQVRWVDPGGNEQSAQYKRLEDARAKRIEVEAELQRGSYVDPRAGRVSFRDYAEGWRAIQAHRGFTAANAERNLRLHVYPHLGDRPLNSIRRSDLQTLVKHLEKRPDNPQGLASSTIGTVLATVTAVFSAAVLDGILAASPVKRVAIAKAPQHGVIIPTTDTVFSIAESVRKRYRRMVRVAMSTGLRQGELAGLCVESVEFLSKTPTITVDPDLGQLVCHAGEKPRLAPPKSAAGARTIPVPHEVVEELSAQIAEYGTGELQGRHLIFTNTRHNPIQRKDMSDILGPVLRDHGFPSGIGWHLFRHFYASCLLAEVPNIKAVQVYLGHENSKETLDTYGHLLPGVADNAGRDAVSRVFRAQKKNPASEETGP